jgi:flagellar hook-associated protein 1 FlgK
MDQLTQLAGVTTHENSLGVADVYIGTRSLVRGQDAYAVKAGTSGTGAPTLTWAADGANAAAGGEVGGYIAVTTVDLPSLKASLNAVAAGLISAVNAQHAAGTGLDGSTGVAFFTGADAATIDLDPGLTAHNLAASVTGAANDGNNALAMARIRQNSSAVTLPSGTTSSITDALGAFGGRLGALASGAAATKSATSTSVDSAQKTRASLNGVSVDEEMVDLVKYQHAYSAAAKVISTADQMLDVLINQLGA